MLCYAGGGAARPRLLRHARPARVELALACSCSRACCLLDQESMSSHLAAGASCSCSCHAMVGTFLVCQVGLADEARLRAALSARRAAGAPCGSHMSVAPSPAPFRTWHSVAQVASSAAAGSGPVTRPEPTPVLRPYATIPPQPSSALLPATHRSECASQARHRAALQRARAARGARRG